MSPRQLVDRLVAAFLRADHDDEAYREIQELKHQLMPLVQEPRGKLVISVPLDDHGHPSEVMVVTIDRVCGNYVFVNRGIQWLALPDLMPEREPSPLDVALIDREVS
jgi:hypothetical protein